MGVCHPPGRMQQPVKHGSPCSAPGGQAVSQALTYETARHHPEVRLPAGLAGPGGDLLEQGGGSLQPVGRLAALPGYPVAVPDRLPDPAWGWRSWGPVS